MDVRGPEWAMPGRLLSTCLPSPPNANPNNLPCSVSSRCTSVPTSKKLLTQPSSRPRAELLPVAASPTSGTQATSGPDSSR